MLFYRIKAIIFRYKTIFNIIKEAALRNDLAFKPKTFQIDFEIGMIVANRDLFRYNTEIK
jgi:hypothetical protein